ncbi:hypothetical protein [Haloechinothrix sp. LS1_15]|uniref:hypothetical protein n=1 Tax=Haloechinothrix sp. LS1_15 TaxID=2652248 RepID=UPI0029489D9E|nr:hypothetical protein [Haloechinothrix sp. LS1_15]MDV6012132.1 hypothetical protein [Haloechinothrix sp. LS1_15]
MREATSAHDRDDQDGDSVTSGRHAVLWRWVGERIVTVVVGLGTVAVLAGLGWWLFAYGLADTGRSGEERAGDDVSAPAAGEADSAEQPDASLPGSPEPLEVGEYVFEPVVTPDTGDDCVAVSYGQVQWWFSEYPCERVVRGLYETRVDGQRVLTSVVTVTMPDGERARQLQGITDTPGAGNISDLVLDGTVDEPTVPGLAGTHYASQVDDTVVTIVEADSVETALDPGVLAELAEEALRLATALR